MNSEINWHFRTVGELNDILGKLPMKSLIPVAPREEQRGQEDDALVLKELPSEWRFGHEY